MAIYRREFLKAGAALVAAAAAQQSRVALAGPDLKQSADEVLQAAVDAGDVPGVIAMATTPGGTIYEGGFGKRALDQDTAMSLDTVVWIASMTKALTGAAAMQLVEQGKLDPGQPGARWITRRSTSTRVLAGWDADGKPVAREPKRPITLRHLLTHTAGFAYELWNTDIQQYQKVKELPGIGSCKNVSLKTPLMFDPGERWEYGINIDWAGKMVEAVSGKQLGEYFQENLFGPLGMNSTGFKITPDMRARLAKVHQRRRRRRLHPIEFEMTQEPEFEMGGGGIYSTAGRLPQVRAHDPQPRQGQRQPGAQARDGGADVAQRHGPLEGHDAEDGDPAADQRRGVLPRHAEELGPELHDQRSRRRRPVAPPAAWRGQGWRTPITGSTRAKAWRACT